MPYKQPFIKLTFGGEIAAGNDEWNCGINLGMYRDGILDGVNNPEAVFAGYNEEMNQDMGLIFSEFFGNNASQIPAGVTLTYIKTALIGTNGEYMADPFVWEVFDANGPLSRAYVPQVSTVVTLASQKRSDPGKYQRFYLPTAAPSGTNGYRFDGASNLAEHSANLIFSLERSFFVALQGYTVQPAAVTQANTPGDNYLPITRVRVGDVYDTQRRRRNRINENYTDELISNAESIIQEPTP